MTKKFNVGTHRPVYLWGGPGTVRMNRLKFMNMPVDEAVHAEAHTPTGAHRMGEEAAFNWAYLMYDWGFPPEIEREDWQDFQRAVQIYHEAGFQVFGYIQTSNCVVAGSYQDKDWYAVDPKGRPFYYYTGRYMTCWSHPAWLRHLQDMVKGVVEAGADGVFFDNPWHGAQPLLFMGTWLGFVGCYCDRCRSAFRESSGFDIPIEISPKTDETSRTYLRWRADQVAQTIGKLGQYAKQLNADVVVSVNNFDAIMRASYVSYGVDLPALAKVQDVMMIEDFALPQWLAQDNSALLVNNALTLRTARALVGDTPLSTDPYDKGIGFDSVYPPRRLWQGIAEAAACGAPMVVKGTEYVDHGTFTLLTAEPFAPQREALGEMHRWLNKHAHLYENRKNVSEVGLLFPGEALWHDWTRLAPMYLGVGQTLLAAGIPWRVVTEKDDGAGLTTLFTFDGTTQKGPQASASHIIDGSGLSCWQHPTPSLLERYPIARRSATNLIDWFYRAYFRWRWARKLGDSLNITRLFLQSPYFTLPSLEVRETVISALGPLSTPRVTSQSPVLVELWQQDKNTQLHLVNYNDEPQTISIDFKSPTAGSILSPRGQRGKFMGNSLEIKVDVYSVVVYQKRANGENPEHWID